MRKLILLLIFLTTTTYSISQELNAIVTIDAQQSGQPNAQVFRTMKQQLEEFLNTTQWTDKAFKNQERIDCSFTLIITDYDGDFFNGSLQVSASRPVFETTYDSPTYNYNDKQVSFNYKEFQPLVFNINSFDSNLVSVLAYHAYTIIGLDADTFALEGGLPYFETAKQIINTASSSNYQGWKATDGSQSRYRFNDALLSNVYSEFHTAMYKYHRLGLDIMSSKPLEAKSTIINAIGHLKNINNRRPNSFLLRTFFDAKAEEIVAIFSGGPKIDIVQLVETLNRLAPTKRSLWSKISY
jgi:hypothetical protein